MVWSSFELIWDIQWFNVKYGIYFRTGYLKVG